MSLRDKIQGLREMSAFSNRAQLILSRILFPRESLSIYRLDGMHILVDHSAGEANSAREVLTTPVYRKYLTAMNLSSPLNVIDLGSNNGGFPLLLKTSGLKLACVTAVELNPNTFSRMRFNLERNLDCRLVLLNAAICSPARVHTLKLGNGSVADSIYGKRTPQGRVREHRIQGMTLDEIYGAAFEDQLVDICKMDVEGAEFEVFFESGHNSIEKCRYLVLEVHDNVGHDPASLLKRLGDRGFAAMQVPGDGQGMVYGFRNERFPRA